MAAVSPVAGGRDRGPPLGLAGLGMELLAAVVGCTLVGLWVDRHYRTEPWGVLVGGLVGIVGGLANFIRQASRAVAAESGAAREAGGRPPDAAAPEPPHGDAAIPPQAPPQDRPPAGREEDDA